MDSARALIARGWGVSLVSRCLRVSRAQLHVILRRTDDWMDGRRSRHTDDTDVLLRIHHVIGELPTYGYRRVWALLRRQAELDGMPAINAKRVYRIMRQNALLLERKPAVPPSKRAHTGRVAVKESNQRWCSDGFEFCCDNGERLRVTFALDCCDREALHWAVTTGGFNSETVQDVMLGAVERRFGNDLPSSPVEWLTDNGSCYRANETRQFARMLGLEPKNTAVRSPESNGIAESFVKTIKRDYISIMPKVARDGIELTDSQIAALERKASDNEACGEIETAHPGYLGSQDTFYVDNLKGVGRIYQQTFVDTYSKVAHCKLYVTKTPITAADLLNDRVLPFYASLGLPILRILTDRGTESCGKVEIGRASCRERV